MENPIKIDDLRVPLFLETPKYVIYTHDACSLVFLFGEFGFAFSGLRVKTPSRTVFGENDWFILVMVC